MPAKPYRDTAGQPRPAPSLARIVPFAVYIAFILLADLLARVGYDAAQLRWLYAAKAGAVLAALVLFRRSYRELAGGALDVRAALIAILCGLAVFALWISLNAGWMQVGSPAGFDPSDAQGRIDWMLVALRIAGAALVVPVMEELFWRSFLLRWLTSADFQSVSPGRVKASALIVSVILFGFEHNLWLAGIVAGAAYSMLYTRSQTLWSPILAHSVTNGVLGVWIVATGNWSFW